MTLEDYQKSDEFTLFLDEELRRKACNGVDAFLRENEPVNKNQLFTIPSIIQASGYGGLKHLIERQKEKNSKPKNKVFWEFLSNLIITEPGHEHSLRTFLRTKLLEKGVLKALPDRVDKSEKNKIKSDNKKVMDQLMESSLLMIYFEHFNCHYFYKTR